jgi:hypothetical protein
VQSGLMASLAMLAFPLQGSYTDACGTELQPSPFFYFLFTNYFQ